MKRRPASLVENEGGPEHYSWSLTGPGEDVEFAYPEEDTADRYARALQAMRAKTPASAAPDTSYVKSMPKHNRLGIPRELEVILETGESVWVPTFTPEGKSMESEEALKRYFKSRGME